jgi:hypothetical protein
MRLAVLHTDLPMALFVGMAMVGGVAGHGMLSVPAPRDGTQLAGPNKGNVGPCGTATDTAATPSAEVTAGAETTVEWNLAAAHGGPCEIRIASTDAGLEGAPLLETVGACNQQASVAVTVPAGLSGNAVLQWYWDGDGPYYDCADITVRAGAAASATAGGALSTDVDDPVPYAEVEVVFTNDMADVEAAGGEWQTGVIRAIATNVGIPAARIEIARILPGSIRVFIRFLEDLTADEADDEEVLSADSAAELFSEQLEAGTDVMTDPSFACCYESHEITQWASPTIWRVFKWFVFVLLMAGCAAGALKFLQWKKESATVKAELELREKEKDAADDVDFEPKTVGEYKSKATNDDGGRPGASAHVPAETSAVVAAGSAQPVRLQPPPLADLESRFFAAAASPSGAEGSGGGWGAVRSASRQIQTARALGITRASRQTHPACQISLGRLLLTCIAHLHVSDRDNAACSTYKTCRQWRCSVAATSAIIPRSCSCASPEACSSCRWWRCYCYWYSVRACAAAAPSCAQHRQWLVIHCATLAVPG